MYTSFVLLVIFSVCFVAVKSLDEGEPCTLNSNGQRGICKAILKCQSALDDIKHQRFPQTCGFAGTVPRVCCPDGPPPTVPPISTTTRMNINNTHRPPPKKSTQKPPSNTSYVNPYKPTEPGYKSFQKCLEYSKLVFTYEKPPILIIDKEEVLENTCGFRVIPLIVGGELASRREFPHMALVGYDSSEGIQWLCGGTLISENFVLTAAHCLISREFGNATNVRLGVTEINDPDNRQDRKVIDLIYYPTYALPSHYDDIGLLKLDKKVNFDIYVRPACLHNFKNPLGQRAVATGWGKTDFAGFPTDKLMKVILSLSDPATCYDSFSRVSQQRLERGIDDKIMVCAGSQGKDTCQGDSGGPLQIYSPIDCMYEIIGVTSFGKACGIGKSPGVYTRVSHYVDWVEKQVF